MPFIEMFDSWLKKLRNIGTEATFTKMAFCIWSFKHIYAYIYIHINASWKRQCHSVKACTSQFARVIQHRCHAVCNVWSYGISPIGSERYFILDVHISLYPFIWLAEITFHPYDMRNPTHSFSHPTHSLTPPILRPEPLQIPPPPLPATCAINPTHFPTPSILPPTHSPYPVPCPFPPAPLPPKQAFSTQPTHSHAPPIFTSHSLIHSPPPSPCNMCNPGERDTI